MIKLCEVKMMKNVTFSTILILLLVEIITCESAIYGFGLGGRYEGIKYIIKEKYR